MKKPQRLYKILETVNLNICDPHPFHFLKTKENRNYAESFVNKHLKVEEGVHKILKESLEVESIILEALGKDHEVSAVGEVVLKGYQKAIEALQKTAEKKEVVEDTAYTGLKRKTLKQTLDEDVKILKEKRKEWAYLFCIRPELRSKSIPKSFIAMISRQTYYIFLFLKKSCAKVGYKEKDNRIYEFIAELLSGIYDSPKFNPKKTFTSEKIKNYCDNVRFHSRMKKTSLHKYLESL